ncbi:hypothetical protein [Pelotomaculum propionicicum]|uniref:Uncharacterized protein n=1 Tax=Pelotomaculum propionicicum TaxID=258475 RepID=A0A4Y7RXC3_9FIRM|nr:hypothetical protein [Pelotomaculum propionicicum]TEB13369.1 hypothetical protein Pmgp_00263 [Pelotomaculum propionicicum]
MAVLIKRYRVRYNGVLYGPDQPAGQVLTGLSEEEEARLIAGSNGTIEKYEPEPEPNLADNEQELCNDEPATEKDANQEPEQTQIPEPEAVTAGDIVNANLDDLIKPANNTEPAKATPAMPKKPSTKNKKRGGK